MPEKSPERQEIEDIAREAEKGSWIRELLEQCRITKKVKAGDRGYGDEDFQPPCGNRSSLAY